MAINATTVRRTRTLKTEDAIARSERMRGIASKVGFPKGEQVGHSSGSNINTMAEVASIAVYNELGTSTIPERPFLSPSMVDNIDKLRGRMYRATKAVMQGSDAYNELSKVGEWMVGEIKLKIRSVDTPPNAQSTIQKKGSSQPLIDTALMLNSVTHVEGKFL